MWILKRITILLLILLVYFLLVYQSFMMLSNLMTSAVITFSWFRLIKQFLTPLMIHTILWVLHPLHIKAVGMATNIIVMKNGTWHNIIISWNCLGWQSVLIFLFTMPFVLLLGFPWLAKLKVLLLGLCGTIAVAVARIVTVILLFQLAGAKPAIFFHDYLAGVGTVTWICCFWWFSYAFLLKHKAVSHTDIEAEAEKGAGS